MDIVKFRPWGKIENCFIIMLYFIELSYFSLPGKGSNSPNKHCLLHHPKTVVFHSVSIWFALYSFHDSVTKVLRAEQLSNRLHRCELIPSGSWKQYNFLVAKWLHDLWHRSNLVSIEEIYTAVAWRSTNCPMMLHIWYTFLMRHSKCTADETRMKEGNN